MKTLTLTALSMAVGALVLGCNGKTNAKMTGVDPLGTDTPPTLPVVTGGSDGGGGGGTDSGTPPTGQCASGQTYAGFGGTELTADRVDNPIGLDRARVKPYSALTTEYLRVLGNNPKLIPSMASTFGSPPARWYEEAQGSAITTYSAFRIAFQGCLTMTAGTSFNTVPNTSMATTQCTTWATNFWSRAPTTAEVTACADYAVNQTTSETNANRRWAYACASVLTGAGFLTY